MSIIRPLEIGYVDAAFALASAIKGEVMPIRILIVGADVASLSIQLNRLPCVLSVREQGRALVIEIDHCSCDALGGLQAIRSAVTGMTAPTLRILGAGTISPRPPSRRFSTVALGHQAKIVTHSDRKPASYTSCFFIIDHVPATSDSLTERIVNAVHVLALGRRPISRSYSSVLVPVTVWPWTDDRPVSNLSSGFVSIVSRRNLECGQLNDLVSAQFATGRQSRVQLLRRTSQFGRLPRPFWGLTRAVCRVLALPRETAVVSNLGTIRDSVLCSLGSVWFFTPPVRTREAVGIGLMKMEGTLTAVVSSYMEPAEATTLGMRLWDLAGIRATEFKVE